MLTNYSLVFSFWQGLDHEWVEDVGLLAIIILVARLVVEAFSQLGLLFTEMILGPRTSETVWPDWIILEGNLGDE